MEEHFVSLFYLDWDDGGSLCPIVRTEAREGNGKGDLDGG